MSAELKKIREEILRELRYVSAHSLNFGQAAADAAGLHSTDIKCLNFLLLDGTLTAGQLSRCAGLTTGAMTATLDRLERRGYVKRQSAPGDRRKVIVSPDREKIDREIGPITASIGVATMELLETYSAFELEVIQRFLNAANLMASQQIARLRGEK